MNLCKSLLAICLVGISINAQAMDSADLHKSFNPRVLNDAIKNKNYAEIRSLLSSPHAELVLKDSSALIQAAHAGDWQATSVLLEYEQFADLILAPNEYGINALSISVAHDDDKNVEVLLKSKFAEAFLDFSDGDQNALLRAVQRQSAKMVRILLASPYAAKFTLSGYCFELAKKLNNSEVLSVFYDYFSTGKILAEPIFPADAQNNSSIDHSSSPSYKRTACPFTSENPSSNFYDEGQFKFFKENFQVQYVSLFKEGVLHGDEDKRLLFTIMHAERNDVIRLLALPIAHDLVKIKFAHGVNALHVAIAMGKNSIVYDLLKSTFADELIERDDFGYNPLYYAIATGNREGLKLLLESRFAFSLLENDLASPDTMPPPLFYALQIKADVAIINELLQSRHRGLLIAPWIARGLGYVTPLQFAVVEDAFTGMSAMLGSPFVAELVKPALDNFATGTALTTAARFNKPQAARMLIAYDAHWKIFSHPNLNRQNPLHIAAENCFADVIEVLMGAKFADAFMKMDRDKNIPQMTLIESPHYHERDGDRALRAMLGPKEGLSPHAPKQIGFEKIVLLFVCAQNGKNLSAAQILAEYFSIEEHRKFFQSLKTEKGDALMQAVLDGNDRVVAHYLNLEFAKDFLVLNDNGQNALHLAILRNHVPSVNAILKSKHADFFIKSGKETPQKLAIRLQRKEIIKIFQDFLFVDYRKLALSEIASLDEDIERSPKLKIKTISKNTDSVTIDFIDKAARNNFANGIARNIPGLVVDVDNKNTAIKFTFGAQFLEPGYVAFKKICESMKPKPEIKIVNTDVKKEVLPVVTPVQSPALPNINPAFLGQNNNNDHSSSHAHQGRGTSLQRSARGGGGNKSRQAQTSQNRTIAAPVAASPKPQAPVVKNTVSQPKKSSTPHAPSKEEQQRQLLLQQKKEAELHNQRVSQNDVSQAERDEEARLIQYEIIARLRREREARELREKEEKERDAWKKIEIEKDDFELPSLSSIPHPFPEKKTNNCDFSVDKKLSERDFHINLLNKYLPKFQEVTDQNLTVRNRVLGFCALFVMVIDSFRNYSEQIIKLDGEVNLHHFHVSDYRFLKSLRDKFLKDLARVDLEDTNFIDHFELFKEQFVNNFSITLDAIKINIADKSSTTTSKVNFDQIEHSLPSLKFKKGISKFQQASHYMEEFWALEGDNAWSSRALVLLAGTLLEKATGGNAFAIKVRKFRNALAHMTRAPEVLEQEIIDTLNVLRSEEAQTHLREFFRKQIDKEKAKTNS